MELIKISHHRYGCGFGPPRLVALNGVKFPNGKIAYQDEEGIIRACESEQELEKTFCDTHITSYPARKRPSVKD